MIVKQAGVMIEAHESIQQLGRLYFAYVHQSVNVTASSSGSFSRIIKTSNDVHSVLSDFHSSCIISLVSYFDLSSLLSEGEMDLPFSRPLVLTRLGQFIMEVKVCKDSVCKSKTDSYLSSFEYSFLIFLFV